MTNKQPVTSDDAPKRQPMTPAQRQAAYRARKGNQINVIIPDDIKAALDAYITRQRANSDADMTMSDVITKLLRAQLLRKR